jgi:toxoflavin biosynthesis protein ToxC
MISHRSPISGVAAFGGRFVATAGYDNQLILWDVLTRQPLSRAGHDHLANHVDFSPDGRYLVSASSDHTSRLWSVPELKLRTVFPDHLDDVEMAVFHPLKELIATASRDHRIRIYDFEGNLFHCLEGHQADVISVVWSLGGEDLISSSDDGTVKRWSLSSGKLITDIDVGGVETDTIAIDEEGGIYAGNDEGNILVIRSGDILTLSAHAAGIKRLVYNRAEKLLVSLSYDRTVCVWTVGKSVSKVAQSLLPPQIWARSCAFIDGKTLAFATFGSSYAIFNFDSDHWVLDHIRPTPGINAVAAHNGQRLTIGDSGLLQIDGRTVRDLGSLCNFIIPAGSRVITGGQMGSVMDALTGEVLHQHHSPLNCSASFIREGRSHAVIGTYTGEGLVFRIDPDGSVAHVKTLPLHANAVKSVSVSDGVIFSVCADTGASWFSHDSFVEIARVRNAHERIANGSAALPGRRFVSVSRDRKMRVWTGQVAEILATPHSHSIKCVAASTDGRYIATGSYSGMVAVYDMAKTRWTVVERPTAAGISSICEAPTGSGFWVSSYDGNIYEIDAASLRLYAPDYA